VAITWEVKAEFKLRNAAKYESRLFDLKLPCNDYKTILQDKEMGQWLSVLPSIANGTEFSAQKLCVTLPLM
jgi:hypothetical protein